MPSHRLPRQLTETGPRWNGRQAWQTLPIPRREVNSPDGPSLPFPRSKPGGCGRVAGSCGELVRITYDPEANAAYIALVQQIGIGGVPSPCPSKVRASNPQTLCSISTETAAWSESRFLRLPTSCRRNS
jgi:hypothetical protein